MAADYHVRPISAREYHRIGEAGYRFAHPEPGDVLLVVEVAKTSWGYERGRKLRAMRGPESPKCGSSTRTRLRT